ncbi:uncharacterized protein si:ch211-227n13.3 isoform X3 [Nerophis ophidion]|uniref:uncharacterized protein si:ch211-227n13.3 isoform X3 n=1 Tax=Nerophis ophidion TaxID=159077 RepID=UPI002ADF3DDA|nr:uncharacterized protein si:ch211-227n13.3 isoform X3 [Nerophis ophidion]
MEPSSSCDPAENRSYTEYESKHFESYTQSFLVKGNSSVVYCLEWKSVMKTRNSSRVENPLIKMPDRSGSSHEEFVIRRKKRQKKDADVRSQEDIIDMIERKYGGLDSAEQGCSSRVAAPKKPTSAGLCSACRKLYQRVKRLKKPMKDKLLDNDPTSLTCDQWVLLKDWHPTRLPQSGGFLPACGRSGAGKSSRMKRKPSARGLVFSFRGTSGGLAKFQRQRKRRGSDDAPSLGAPARPRRCVTTATPPFGIAAAATAATTASTAANTRWRTSPTWWPEPRRRRRPRRAACRAGSRRRGASETCWPSCVATAA